MEEALAERDIEAALSLTQCYNLFVVSVPKAAQNYEKLLEWKENVNYEEDVQKMAVGLVSPQTSWILDRLLPGTWMTSWYRGWNDTKIGKSDPSILHQRLANLVWKNVSQRKLLPRRALGYSARKGRPSRLR